MRKLVSLTLTILALSSVLCAQGEARLANWTYQTDSRYLGDAYVDKTGAMLSDGDTKGLVIYATGGTAITIDLAERSHLTGVAVNVTRPNNNYKLREVRVQADVFGDWRDLGQVAGFWGPTAERSFRLQIPNLDATTSKVRLVFNNPGVLSLSEIELFGQAVTKQAQAQLQTPFIADPKPSAREQDLDGDGKPEVILENDLVRLIFAPLTGGACRSLVYKPAQQEFALSQDPGYGLLRDQLWAPAYMFADRPYSWRLGGDANSAWAELSVTGAGGMMSFTTLTKRVEITRGSPVARVHYKLLNDPSSQTDYTYGFWVHNFMGAIGQPMRYFFPTEGGVQELAFPLPKGQKQSDYWWKDPARGWTAVCGENGTGLATQADYKYLNCYYNWAGTGYPAATHEWRYNRVALKTGQAFETNVALLPFSGLTRVDGVVGDVLGSIALQDAKGSPAPPPGSSAGFQPAQAVIKLLPASSQAPAATGLIRLKQLPSGAWQDLGQAEMPAGKAAEQPVKLGALGPGSYLLNVQVQRGGKTLDDFERPFAVGGAQIAYQREPLEQRVGLGAEEKASSLPRHDLSDAIVTPHVPWATPLPGGPLKALVLCDDFVAREVIELKQRLQMDLTYVKFRTLFWTEDLYCGDRTISTPEQANKRLQDALKTTKFDVLIISGFNWGKHFKPETQQAIMAQVKAGTGLILIEPDGFTEADELAPIAGIAKTRSMWAFSKWQRGEQSPLTAGLPWETMPATRYMDYTKWPEGKVLATLDKGQPLLVTNQFGAGRTAVLTYDTLTHDMSYRGYAGLIPIFSYRGGFLREEYNALTWEYWEPYYALLARLSVWAAKRDTGVEIVSLEPLAQHDYGQQVALPLRLSGGQGDYTVAATFASRTGHALQEVKLPYKPGQGEVALPVPPLLPAGLNSVNVIVKDRAGAHVAWGQTTVTGTTPVAIKTLAPEAKTLVGTRAPRGGQLFNPAFACDQPAKLTVELEQRTPAPGLQLQARLYDTHRRLLFEETRPASGAATETFSAPLPELRSQGLQWEVALIGAQGQLDFATCRALCLAPRDWDHYRLTNWGGVYTWRSEYLNDALGGLVEPLVDISFGGGTENDSGKTWLNLWHNIGYSHLGLLGYMGKDVPDFMERNFSDKATKYAQTKDKQYLVRTPSLADKAWRGKVMASMAARAADDIQRFGGAYDYCMGDEMSLTYYTRYFDFDYDPRNLADFREWLKGRYADLAALNQAWGTSFATWDAVMPLTLDEARQAANAAPWAEFRSFMDDTMAGFCAEIKRSLTSVDPQTRAGLSGTQEPRAGNGMDWWKMSQGFNYYHAYNTGWSNEMRRSFAPYTGVQQTPYFAGYWQSGRALEYNMFWCLLHDCTSISAWDTNVMFYNDFTYSEGGRDTLALSREFKRGLWDLVRTGQWEHDGIAIQYSQAAIAAAQLAAKEEEHKDVRDVWVKLLEDLGLQYNFVATQQIEGGLLTKPKNDFERYRVLILPEAMAITAKERAAIEEFVKGGGTVIGDFGIGVYDGLCRKPAAGMLDGLFGVKREGQANTALDLEVKLPGAQATGVKLPVAEGLVAAGATSYALTVTEPRSQALFVNRVGKGSACYLNVDLRQYEDERTFHTPGEKQIRAILGALLAQAGVKPALDITFASGVPANLEVTRHQAGDLLFLGFERTGGEGDELATIRLPAAAYVYDCRDAAGQPAGKRAEIKATFAGKQARVYCVSPAPLAAPQLALKAPTAKPGDVISYTVSLKGGVDTRRQVVHLTVLAPDGTEYRDYDRNVLLGSKPFTGSFRLALNDAPGKWRVIARDVASGQTTDGTFEVR